MKTPQIHVPPLTLNAAFCVCGAQMRLHSHTRQPGYDELVWHCPPCSREVPVGVAVRYNERMSEPPIAVLPHREI